MAHWTFRTVFGKGKWMMTFKQPGTSSTEIKEVSADQGSGKTEEEVQRSTASFLTGTSAKSSKHVHAQGILKRIGRDSVSDVAVPGKKTKEDYSKANAQRLQEEANADSMTMNFKYLSEHIGREWRLVGRNLGLQDAELDHIEAGNLWNTQRAIYQMFVEWKRKQGSNATYGILLNALEQSGRRDLVEYE